MLHDGPNVSNMAGDSVFGQILPPFFLPPAIAFNASLVLGNLKGSRMAALIAGG